MRPLAKIVAAIAVLTAGCLRTGPAPLQELVAGACASSCNGPGAEVTVFRDADGKPGRLRLDGSLQACSHPPRVYFDGLGTRTVTIPNEPVVPGSPQAKNYEQIQQREVAGLVEGETMPCPQ